MTEAPKKQYQAEWFSRPDEIDKIRLFDDEAKACQFAKGKSAEHDADSVVCFLEWTEFDGGKWGLVGTIEYAHGEEVNRTAGCKE